MDESEEQPAETASRAAVQRKIGPYVLMRELGRGGAATVYKALDTRNGTVVALKALASVPYHEDQDQMALLVRMEREARAVEGLSHPNIVRVIEVGFAGDSPETLIPYFAMEFLSGETLRQRLDRDGALPLEIAAKILDQAAAALDAVHASGVVHRDVKPGNLMLMKENFVKLMDFGIARQSDDATITQAGMMVGSPAYMSPEQAVGDSATAVADIWGLSVVLYEMVTGTQPFRGANIPTVLYEIRHGAPITIPESVPAPVSDVLHRALNREPNRRYSIASGLAKAFRAALVASDGARAVGASNPLAGGDASTGTAKPWKPERLDSPRQPKRLPHSVPAYLFVAAAAAVVIVFGRLVPSLILSGNPSPKSSHFLTRKSRAVTSEAAASDSAKSGIKSAKRAAAKSDSAASAISVVRLGTHLQAKALLTKQMRPAPAKLSAAQTAAIKKFNPRPAALIVRAAAPPPPSALAQVSLQQERQSSPQPMPVPSSADDSSVAQSPVPSSPAVEATAAGPTTPIDVPLAGVWHGTYSDHPALLLLNRPSPDDGLFDGTLTVRLKNGAVIIDVRGHVKENGTLTFREQKVIAGAEILAWSLGLSAGFQKADGTLHGSGTAVDGHAFGWGFHR